MSKLKGVFVASRIRKQPLSTGESVWGLDALAGRFVEITGTTASAALTTSASLILQSQQRGDFSAWISAHRSIFYPPDFAASGIDLDALPVIQIEDISKAARAVEALLRSGGFALILFDIFDRRDGVGLTITSQTRLAGLARKHNTALVCLTRKGRRTGSLVSIRAESEMKRLGFDRFSCELRVVKDKSGLDLSGRRGHWGSEVWRGPDGLC